MLLSDDRNLPMPLQKTQNINNQFRAFGRDWPNRSSACARRSARLPPAQFFCARKDPRIHQPLTFLSQQSFGYCPRAKRSRSNTHAGVVGYLFETAHNAIAPMRQPGAYIRSCELSGVVERAHSNVARKRRGGVEHKARHAGGPRGAYSQFRGPAQSPECWTRNFVSAGPPAGAGGKISQRRDRVCCRHLQDFQKKSPAETGLRLWMTRWRRDVVSSVMTLPKLSGTRSGGNKTTLGGLPSVHTSGR